MAKKKQAEDLYDLIAGALPTDDSQEESVVEESKKEGTTKYNKLSYAYGVVKEGSGRSGRYSVVEIAFDISTDFSKIERVLEVVDNINVAIGKAEQYNRSNLMLNRRKP